ncbi:phage tail terminator family protein [Paenibacillus tyrfis]|uniref:Uncharacterized protein n=1 Tax=Paenibacillus tyrfis TaxID=1501230 RepID=A0A081P4F4_9BACL|nr:hypothetical protein [Paenibacillus tyrfis]KEQ25577.1 hypothetical protein ET33_02320 [Paenibacillus tyrfis]
MLRDSLDAVRSVMKEVRPELNIYVNAVPEDFVSPSFYVYPEPVREERLTKRIMRGVTVWHIHYFPKQLPSDIVDSFDQIEMSDLVRRAFSSRNFLRSPTREVYTILSVVGGPEEDRSHIQVSLEGQWLATTSDPSANPELMKEVHYKEELSR